MKHEHSSSPLPETPPSPPLVQWHVYTADRRLVATYSQEAAAASHIASWPAAYYIAVASSPPAPVSTLSVPS